ncbi:hypothetical protein [Streptomyces sp. NPDC001089]
MTVASGGLGLCVGLNGLVLKRRTGCWCRPALKGFCAEVIFPARARISSPSGV